MNTPLRLVGYNKKKNIEVTLLLYDHDERKTVKDAYYFFEPDTLIQCREFDSGVILAELQLEDIFSKPKNRNYENNKKRR